VRVIVALALMAGIVSGGGRARCIGTMSQYTVIGWVGPQGSAPAVTAYHVYLPIVGR
jgi:hypothetical protein